MNADITVFLITFLAIVSANIPWVMDNLFIFIKRDKAKNFLMRLCEWFVFYLLIGLFSAGLEIHQNGTLHHQGWEFYVTTFCLFVVFALPGFIYQYEFKRYLERLEN